LTVSQRLYSRGAFSKILRTVAKIATSYLYDMIWNLFKKFELFLNSLKNLVIFAVLSGYIVKTFL